MFARYFLFLWLLSASYAFAQAPRLQWILHNDVTPNYEARHQLVLSTESKFIAVPRDSSIQILDAYSLLPVGIAMPCLPDTSKYGVLGISEKDSILFTYQFWGDLNQGSFTMKAWDFHRGKEVSSCERQDPYSFSNTALHLLSIHDSSFIISKRQVYSAYTGKVQNDFRALLPDDEYGVACYKKQLVYIKDSSTLGIIHLEDGKQTTLPLSSPLPIYRAMAHAPEYCFSHHDSLLAIVRDDSVCVIDYSSGKVINSFYRQGKDFCFVSQEYLLAKSESLFFLFAKTENCSVLFDIASGSIERIIPFSSSGYLLPLQQSKQALGVTLDGAVELWDILSASFRKRLYEPGDFRFLYRGQAGCAFMRDGQDCIISDGSHIGVVDVRSGRMKRSFACGGYTVPITNINRGSAYRPHLLEAPSAALLSSNYTWYSLNLEDSSMASFYHPLGKYVYYSVIKERSPGEYQSIDSVGRVCRWRDSLHCKRFYPPVYANTSSTSPDGNSFALFITYDSKGNPLELDSLVVFEVQEPDSLLRITELATLGFKHNVWQLVSVSSARTTVLLCRDAEYFEWNYHTGDFVFFRVPVVQQDIIQQQYSPTAQEIIILTKSGLGVYTIATKKLAFTPYNDSIPNDKRWHTDFALSSDNRHVATINKANGDLYMWDISGLLNSTEDEEENVLHKEEISLFPSPATECIALRHPYTLPARLLIYNALGAVVYQRENYQSNSSIDLHNLAPGVYYVQLSFGDTHHRRAFVKE